MKVDLKTFEKFNDPGLASAIADKLEKQGIHCVVEKVKPLLEPSFFRNTVEQTIHLKVRAADLERAHKALEDHYRQQLQDVDPGYYLFSFTDIELLDILAKPDEWGHFDHVLALKLLAERGLEIPEETVEEMKRQRQRQLAEQATTDNDRSGLQTVGAFLDDVFAAMSRRLERYINKERRHP